MNLFSAALAQDRRRVHFTDQSKVLKLPVSVEELKTSLNYVPAKAGDHSAAEKLIREVFTQDFAHQLRDAVPPGTLFVFPHAEEASGRNAIPAMFASACASITGGELDDSIVQTSRAFHTGAGMMERMISGVEFDGVVIEGQTYALVDDNVTSGGTMADLGSFIVAGGGLVVAVIALTAGAKFGTVPVNRKSTIRLVKERFGDALENELGIVPESLTDSELSYLRNFPNLDALRNRIVKARQEKAGRLGSKGFQELRPGEVGEPVPVGAAV